MAASPPPRPGPRRSGRRRSPRSRRRAGPAPRRARRAGGASRPSAGPAARAGGRPVRGRCRPPSCRRAAGAPAPPRPRCARPSTAPRVLGRRGTGDSNGIRPRPGGRTGGARRRRRALLRGKAGSFHPGWGPARAAGSGPGFLRPRRRGRKTAKVAVGDSKTKRRPGRVAGSGVIRQFGPAAPSGPGTVERRRRATGWEIRAPGPSECPAPFERQGGFHNRLKGSTVSVLVCVADGRAFLQEAERRDGRRPFGAAADRGGGARFHRRRAPRVQARPALSRPRRRGSDRAGPSWPRSPPPSRSGCSRWVGRCWRRAAGRRGRR
jgi:hypothetical protein